MDKPLPNKPHSIPTRDFIAQTLAPLVAVTASEDAEELCRVNNIPSFADFIRPFGDAIEGRVTPRDWQGTPIPIDNFNIRFRPINKLKEPDHQAVMQLVQEKVKAKGNGSDQHLKEIRDRNDVTLDYLNTPLDELTPWYADFKNTILSLRGITEYETFDHPVATMIVISSANPDPISTIMQLYNPNVPSFTIDKPYVDTNILRYYVVLHDPNRTSIEEATSVFEKLKRTVGLHCYLLTINSKSCDPNNQNEKINKMAEPDIQSIWEPGLTETYRIESELQSYSQGPLDNVILPYNNAAVAAASPTGSSPTMSGNTTPMSSPGHTRSSSANSSISNTLPSTVIHGTSIQSDPIDLLDGTDESQVDKPNVFESDTVESDPIIQYGCCITQTDVTNVQAMVREFSIQSLIPFMERNIQQWNEQVASARRGLTGRLFGASRRLFGTNSRSSTPQSVQTISISGPNVPNGVSTLTIYPFSAPEAQMRKLADFSFMLRDYKFAHTIYDTVRRDYATEKAYKYHAGTQEMLGICTLMMNNLQGLQLNKTDVDRNFELAVQQYIGRCQSIFHATRTTIIYYELLKAHKMWKDIPTALVRMTGEDSDLRSGLFLEQAAHCFLRAKKPMVRKYGFHLVMAGHRYGKSSQRLHAYRAYKLASYVLDDPAWSIAKSHIQFALGRQAYHLGRLEDAVRHFSNVLSDTAPPPQQQPQQQMAHVREFLFIYKQFAIQQGFDPQKESLDGLALPVIRDESVQVTLSNAITEQQQQSINGSKHEAWTAMELSLLEDSIARGYISGSKKAMAVQQQDEERVVCAVGEPSIVHIELINPLSVAISLSEVLVECQYSSSTEAQTQDSAMVTASPHTMPEAGNQVEKKENVLATMMTLGNNDVHEGAMFDFGNFELEKLSSITLEPLERKKIHLTIVPKYEGSLQVMGLHYTLNELVHTFRPFHKQGKRLNGTKEEMMSVVYAPDRSLDILVTSPMPLLDLAFHNVPETIMSGEVVQTVLEINNKGNKGLTALRVKCSHPSFICVGNPEEMDKDIYASTSTTIATDSKSVENIQLDNQLFDPSVISIPLPAKKSQGQEQHDSSSEQGVVEPGETTLVPLWIRGDRIGKHTFQFLFSYQSEKDNVTIAHRTLRYTLNIQVLPSLKINAFTRPSATAVNEYILGVEVENLQTGAQFDLTQLTATSPMWTISPLSIDLADLDDVKSKTVIPPRQTTFAYYKIRKSETVDTSCPEEWTSKALGNLLYNVDNGKSKTAPPPIKLNVSKLLFRKDRDISFDTLPLKTFSLNSRIQWRQDNLTGLFPSIAQGLFHDLFTLYDSSNIDLTLYWDMPDLTRHGHHYIIGVNLGVQQNPYQGNSAAAAATTEGMKKKIAARSLFEATAKERALLVNNLTRNRALKDESPIKLKVSAPDKQRHDFEKEGLLKVPVEISLQNCSWNKISKYTLELLPWSDNDTTGSNGKKKTNAGGKSFNIFPFHWTGATVYEGTLEPNEGLDIRTFATFQLPGVYDVNRWKLTVRTNHEDEMKDSEVFVHQPSLPHLIETVAI